MRRNTMVNDGGSSGTGFRTDTIKRKRTNRWVDALVRGPATSLVEAVGSDALAKAGNVARNALKAGASAMTSAGTEGLMNRSYNVEPNRRRISPVNNRSSRNQTLTNDGGGYSSQYSAQDKAYANAYRNSRRTKKGPSRDY